MLFTLLITKPVHIRAVSAQITSTWCWQLLQNPSEHDVMHTVELAFLLYRLQVATASLAVTRADSVTGADDVFQLLHMSVAVLFSEQLQKDLVALKEGRATDVSLAAKWAPTPARNSSATFASHCLFSCCIAKILLQCKHTAAAAAAADCHVHCMATVASPAASFKQYSFQATLELGPWVL